MLGHLSAKLWVAILVVLSFTGTAQAQSTPVVKTFDVSQTFNISTPATSGSGGFNYGFSKLAFDPTIVGNSATVTKVAVSAFGVSNGTAIDFDFDVLLGPNGFNFPAGAIVGGPDPFFIPVSAPTELHFVVGSEVPTSGTFGGTYDFTSQTLTTSPATNVLKVANNPAMNLPSGLYAQVFIWTGDPRVNVDISSITITVTFPGYMPRFSFGQAIPVSM